MRILLKILLLTLIINTSACKGSKETSNPPELLLPDAMIEERMPVEKKQPQAIVYMTNADFYDYVPVAMNYNRTKIVSYPAPSDIYYKGKLAKPTKLKNGYLLDNRGINENVAFLSYTYEEYSKLKETPSMSELMNNIKEKYPLKIFVKCGPRSQYKDEVNDLNKLIDTDFLNYEKRIIF